MGDLLQQLPRVILHSILLQVTPADLCRLSRACRWLGDQTKDPSLWQGKVNLSSSKLSNAHLMMLAPLLKGCNQLELSHSQITDAGIFYSITIARPNSRSKLAGLYFLVECKNLQEIIVHDCKNVTFQGVCDLINVLQNQEKHSPVKVTGFKDR
jgi:hypothetical protein